MRRNTQMCQVVGIHFW